MINDLYYPPTTHPHIIGMQFFLLLDPWIIRIARGYNRDSRITSTHTPYWFRHCCTRFTQTLFAVCMQSMWVTYMVQKQHGLILISHRTRLQSAHHSCLQQTQYLSIILISNPNIVTENAFSALWSSFIKVRQSFIDVSKCKKYKQCINQCIYF